MKKNNKQDINEQELYHNARAVGIIFFSFVAVLTIKVFIPFLFDEYLNIARLVVWLSVAYIYSMYTTRLVKYRNNRKIRSLITIMIIYYILLFSAGALIGYASNPLFGNLFQVASNIATFGTIAIAVEYTRTKVVEYAKKPKYLIIIAICFILSQIDYKTLIDCFGKNEILFEYIVKTIFPIIASNIVQTYLAKVGGFKLNLTYTIPTTLVMYIFPFLPNIDWFLNTALNIILVVIIIAYINFEIHVNDERNNEKKIIKHQPKKIFITVILLIGLVTFVSGIAPYKPIAIMSNSMSPTFKRGAVVIIKQMKTDKDFHKIQIGDVLEYKTSGGVIVHRVVDIKCNSEGHFVYVTKGDANNSTDDGVVEEKQVVGVGKMWIPYIGYPSCWVAELLFNQKSHL